MQILLYFLYAFDLRSVLHEILHIVPGDDNYIMRVYTVVSAGKIMRGTGRSGRSRRTGRTGRHRRSWSGRTTAAVVRRSRHTVLLQLHEDKGNAVRVAAAAAHTPCLRSRRRAYTARYGNGVLSLGRQGEDNGVPTRYLAGGNKLAVPVSDSYIKVILRDSAGDITVVHGYRKSALTI